MEIAVVTERILTFKDDVTATQAEELANQHKIGAFGTFNQVTSLWNKPKDDDFELIYQEHRFQPFWHVKGTAKYVYDRKAQHAWPVAATEVQSLTLCGSEYEVKNGKINVEVLEHCQQQETKEIFVDGLSGKHHSHLSKYFEFKSSVVEKEELEKLAQKSIIVPPQTRASALVRDTASSMIRSIQADHIFEEKVELEHVDLYYRPLYLFKYKWLSKNKEAGIEVDALTGEVTYSDKMFSQLTGKVLDYDFLFDIGGDVAGTFIPGGNIAVKLTKKYIDVAHRKK
ncbi:MAG TPA: hypothetical protein VD999_06105 [Vitreimonas sp.]|nr:hypothetical protein [Vitreimonas sp.]